MNSSAQKCVSVTGNVCVRFSRAERAKLYNIFMGSVLLAVGLSAKLAKECVAQMCAMGQNVRMVEA